MARRLTTEQFVELSMQVHYGKYFYNNVEYKNNKTKVCIICPEHGEFWQTPANHLQGHGCPKCSEEISRDHFKTQFQYFEQRANEIHQGKYLYTNVNYVNSYTKVCIICPEHGEFWQTPVSHLQGRGCPKCGRLISSLKQKYTEDELITEFIRIHGDKYLYKNISYKDIKSTIKITCPEHGDFLQIAGNHLQGHGCPKCGLSLSLQEENIVNYIKSFYDGDIIQRDRKVIKPKELDIFIPEKMLAIEYNGLLWHSERYTKGAINFHNNKLNICKSNGIKLLHIFEDEWLYKTPIVKSLIKKTFRYVDNKIDINCCIVHELSSEETDNFLEENYIQGRCKAKYRYGLYYNNLIVSVMLFNPIKDDNYKLICFCDKLYTVIDGGANKLLNYFIDKVKPKRILAYSDKRLQDEKTYETLGFTHTHDSKPNYFYVINHHRENRFKYRKGELVRQGYDPSKSEHEIMLERGIPRIYDCGTMAFEMIII